MDFKVAVTGTVEPPEGVDLEEVKEAMADVLHRAMSALRGVTPKAFYLQVGQGTKVNVITSPAPDAEPNYDMELPKPVSVPVPPMPVLPHEVIESGRERRAGRWED